jgi:ATP-dependent Clp protease ATP-binding subunit ClpA
MFERFTRPARHAVQHAREAADRLGQGQVRPEHLLLGVAAAGDEVGARVLAGFGLDAAGLERALTSRERRARLSDLEIAALRSVGIDADEVFRRIEEAFGDPDWFLGGEETPRDAAGRPGRRLGLRPGRSGRRRGTGPDAGTGRDGGGRRVHADTKRALEQSLRQAMALKHRHVGTEHLLLALLAIPQPPLAEVLAAHGVTYRQARDRVLDALRPTHPR